MASFRRRQQNITRLSEQELALASTYESSWHYRYRSNDEIYVGGIADELNEGDMIVVFSQYGRIVDIHMPWNADGDEHQGWCFLKYEDPRSCVLAVDNLNGIELNGKTLLWVSRVLTPRVDHSESNEQRLFNEKWGENGTAFRKTRESEHPSDSRKT